MAKVEQLKVSSTSNPSSVAGSIAKNLQEKKKVELTAIGAGAVNQMNKAVAIASGYVAPHGMTLLVKVAWANVQIGEETKSAIKHIITVVD